MYFHASQTGGIAQLEPRNSNHGVPLVYFSKKRENVLVYLSNAIEKYCKETSFFYNGIWQKWGPYGFDENGILQIEEYYPDAISSTYKGVSGYIYRVENIICSEYQVNIPDAAVTESPVAVDGAEFVPDAYEAILLAEREKRIKLVRYDELTDRKREWIRKTIKEEYDSSADHPEYRHFLRGKFPDIID